MAIKFSEDIVPLSDVKINPGKVVRRTKDSHRSRVTIVGGRGLKVQMDEAAELGFNGQN